MAVSHAFIFYMKQVMISALLKLNLSIYYHHHFLIDWCLLNIKEKILWEQICIKSAPCVQTCHLFVRWKKNCKVGSTESREKYKPASKVETITGELALPSRSAAVTSPVKAMITTEYLVNAFKSEISKTLASSFVFRNWAL